MALRRGRKQGTNSAVPCRGAVDRRSSRCSIARGGAPCASLKAAAHVPPHPLPPRADHGPQRRGRRQPSAGDAGGAGHAARRRQRGGCRGGDLAGARRGRADDVRPRRRRLLPGVHGDRPARRAAGTPPARRRSPRRRNDSRARGIAVRGPLSVSTPGPARRAGARCTPRYGTLPWRHCATRRSPRRATASRPPITTATSPPTCGRSCAADARSHAVFLGGLEVGVPALASLIVQPDLARTLEEIAADGAATFYRGALAARLVAGMRAAGVLVDARDLGRCQPQAAGADRDRLSRLPRDPDAAELDRLHHAADAEDRRAFRSCRARSGAAHPRAGGGEEARLPRPRALRHRSALRRGAAGPAAVRRLCR